MPRPQVRDLLHADRIFRMMDAGLTFKEAVDVDDASAEVLIEAWDIATECVCPDCEKMREGK